MNVWACTIPVHVTNIVRPNTVINCLFLPCFGGKCINNLGDHLYRLFVSFSPTLCRLKCPAKQNQYLSSNYGQKQFLRDYSVTQSLCKNIEPLAHCTWSNIAKTDEKLYRQVQCDACRVSRMVFTHEHVAQKLKKI